MVAAIVVALGITLCTWVFFSQAYYANNRVGAWSNWLSFVNNGGGAIAFYALLFVTISVIAGLIFIRLGRRY